MLCIVMYEGCGWPASKLSNNLASSLRRLTQNVPSALRIINPDEALTQKLVGVICHVRRLHALWMGNQKKNTVTMRVQINFAGAEEVAPVHRRLLRLHWLSAEKSPKHPQKASTTHPLTASGSSWGLVPSRHAALRLSLESESMLFGLIAQKRPSADGHGTATLPNS